MARAILAGILIAVALLIYSLIDLTVTEDARIRRLNRILWIVIIVLIPVIGPIAWVVAGKGPRGMGDTVAPDDDPKFGDSTPKISDEEADRRIREIEDQLAALEAEEAAEREAREAAEHEEHEETSEEDSETNDNGTSDATGRGDRPGA